MKIQRYRFKVHFLVAALFCLGGTFVTVELVAATAQAKLDLPLQEQQPRTIGGGIQLQSARGIERLADYQGKVVVMFFGFTHCPDVCPRDLSIMAQAFNGLSKDQMQQAQGIFVSLDPQRDSVKKLDEFTQYFHPSFIGLTGDRTNLKQITERFGIRYKKVSNKESTQDYGIEHTASMYILDREGRLSYILPNGISPLALRQSIEYLLKQDSASN